MLFTGIALRSVRHSLHGPAVVSFHCLCALGCACSALYAKSTPNMWVILNNVRLRSDSRTDAITGKKALLTVSKDMRS